MNKGTCIHYTGLRNKESCCAAGINYYDKFSGEETGVILRMPCVQYHVLPAHGRGTYIKPGDATIRKEIDRHGRVMMACDQYLEPTDAEIEQDRIDSEACLRRAMAGIEIAAAWRVRPKPKEDRSEIVECPICQGKLHLAQSSHNGHVSGQCETEHCVSWIE
jgi:hypothetical protein